ncbi:hypothetical protein ANN_27622 [Periplaneta americana]|uniref:Uncharacterized protein n=1 Tax=Periplaneta americana TaxID=6978 RepID=A0ABQ8RWE5_PERAM|nr:hypothetical protein ANN_27622 [Periplaneta americana]
MPGMKAEFVDDSYDLTSEIKVEEGQGSFDFPVVKCEGLSVVKCEAVEGSFDQDGVKEELKLEGPSEKDEVFESPSIVALAFQLFFLQQSHIPSPS